MEAAASEVTGARVAAALAELALAERAQAAVGCGPLTATEVRCLRAGSEGCTEHEGRHERQDASNQLLCSTATLQQCAVHGRWPSSLHTSITSLCAPLQVASFARGTAEALRTVCASYSNALAQVSCFFCAPKRGGELSGEICLILLGGFEVAPGAATSLLSASISQCTPMSMPVPTRQTLMQVQQAAIAAAHLSQAAASASRELHAGHVVHPYAAALLQQAGVMQASGVVRRGKQPGARALSGPRPARWPG